MPNLEHDGLRFHYLDRGKGIPVVFQHGLGGDVERVFDQITLPDGFRLIGLDCRGHGKTAPLGEVGKLRFRSFAEDAVVLLDHLKISCAVVGGTSMGAAVALTMALRFPKRLLGLVLLRPAWLDEPNETNARIFATIACLLREKGPMAGLETFKKTSLFTDIQKESMDSAESLVALFRDPRALETLPRLEFIPQDAPDGDRRTWSQIAVPSLVMATRGDPIHPFGYGQIIADAMGRAKFRELPPKSVDSTQYLAALRNELAAFLQDNFITSSPKPNSVC